MKKEVKLVSTKEEVKKEFVSYDESLELQKNGYRVVEIKVIDGIKKHRLEKIV